EVEVLIGKLSHGRLHGRIAVGLSNLGERAGVEEHLHSSTSRMALGSRSSSSPSKDGPSKRNSLKLCRFPTSSSYVSAEMTTTASFRRVMVCGPWLRARLTTSESRFLASARFQVIRADSILASQSSHFIRFVGSWQALPRPERLAGPCITTPPPCMH